MIYTLFRFFRIGDPKMASAGDAYLRLIYHSLVTHHPIALEAFNLMACCYFYVSVSFFIFFIMMTTAPCFFHFSLVTRGRDFGAKKTPDLSLQVFAFFHLFRLWELGIGYLAELLLASSLGSCRQNIYICIYIYIFI